jgi:hypothetical protein
MRNFAIMALLACLPPVLSGARLTLRDGSVIYGQFINGNAQRIVFQDDNGMRRQFNLNQVQGIDFSNVTNSLNRNNTYSDQRSGVTDNNNSAYRTDDRGRGNDNRGRGTYAVLPAGEEISVRTDETIDERNAAEGRTFSASIVEDVRDSSGNVIVPRGAPATLVVRRVSEGGTLSSGNFVLDLDSVRVNGRRYVVNTEDVKKGETGIGANKRTAEYVGGGAVLGTLLGAIAGGGKGAAIGAIAGAAAGGGVQVLTKGKEIRVPAETVLKFRLEEPLTLREG